MQSRAGGTKCPAQHPCQPCPGHFSMAIHVYLHLSPMLQSTNPFSTWNFDPNFTIFSALRARQGARGAVLSLVLGQDWEEWQAGSGKALVE